eukprot:scpid74330/ scgid18836/ 
MERWNSASSDASLLGGRKISNISDSSAEGAITQELYPVTGDEAKASSGTEAAAAAVGGSEMVTEASPLPTGAEKNDQPQGPGAQGRPKLMRKQTSKILFDKSRLPPQVSEEDDQFRPTSEQETCAEGCPDPPRRKRSVATPLATKGKVLFDFSNPPPSSPSTQGVGTEHVTSQAAASGGEDDRQRKKSSSSDVKVLFSADGIQEVPAPLSRNPSTRKPLRLSSAFSDGNLTTVTCISDHPATATATATGVGGKWSYDCEPMTPKSSIDSGAESELRPSLDSACDGGAAATAATGKPRGGLARQTSRTLFQLHPDPIAGPDDRGVDSHGNHGGSGGHTMALSRSTTVA